MMVTSLLRTRRSTATPLLGVRQPGARQSERSAVGEHLVQVGVWVAA